MLESTRFSALAGTPLAGTPFYFLSKQTAKSHFSTSEPEHLEPDHKQGSKALLEYLNSNKKSKKLYKLLKRLPQFTIVFAMATFVADSLRDIRRLCDHARVNLELSNDVYISGKAFFLTSDRFKVFDLF